MADIGIIKFELAHMNFGMYADQILEILRYGGTRAVPCPLPYVVGIFELRRHIVTVVDLHKRVGLPSLPLTKDTVMIVTALSSGTFGILVDNISDFRRVPEHRILPPIPIAGLSEHLLRGVFPDGDDILPIPDFDKMFSSFMHLHLVPINFSEKIAFHYRFTPGSLTQTLEHNLLAQQRLDYDMVKKLPRSLSLPSTQVHRMTTYYADFCPHRQNSGEQPLRYASVSRAGDEQYAALSQQFKAQHRQAEGKSPSPGSRPEPAYLADLADYEASASSAAVALEHLLHQRIAHQPDAAYRPYREFPKHFRLRASIGRPLAQKLALKPVRLAGYLSYYRSPEQSAQTPVQQADTASEPSLETLLPHLQQPEGNESLIHALLNTLHALHATQRTLTRTMVARLCAEYQVSPLKLARILSFFPEYTVPVMLDMPHDDDHSGSDIPKQSQTLIRSTPARPVPPQIDPAKPYVTDNLWQLADQHALFDEQALREAASRRGVPTCRLSKLQRYYWWTHE